MFPSPEQFFQDFSEFATDFQLIRDNEVIDTVKGFIDFEKSEIQVDSQIKIFKNDVLYSEVSKEKYYVKEATMDIFANQIYGTTVKYVIDPTFLNTKEENKVQHINIGSIQGNAIIGSQETASIMTQNITNNSLEDLKELINSKSQEDKEILNKLLNYLEVIEETNPSISKGIFARFSNVLSKNKDVAIAVGNWIVTWLTQNNK